MMATSHMPQEFEYIFQRCRYSRINIFLICPKKKQKKTKSEINVDIFISWHVKQAENRQTMTIPKRQKNTYTQLLKILLMAMSREFCVEIKRDNKVLISIHE